MFMLRHRTTRAPTLSTSASGSRSRYLRTISLSASLKGVAVVVGVNGFVNALVAVHPVDAQVVDGERSPDLGGKDVAPADSRQLGGVVQEDDLPDTPRAVGDVELGKTSTEAFGGAEEVIVQHANSSMTITSVFRSFATWTVPFYREELQSMSNEKKLWTVLPSIRWAATPLGGSLVTTSPLDLANSMSLFKR